MVLATAVLLLAALLHYAIDWVLQTFSDPKIDEILFVLRVPLRGANHDYIVSFLAEALAPALLCAALLAFTYVVVAFVARASLEGREGACPQRPLTAASVALLVFALFAMGASVSELFERSDLGEYVQAQMEQSSLIENEYVDPQSVELTFPEERRNLIYIYLESMEASYYSSAEGGFYETGLVPELEQLALENIAFSSGERLEGMYPAYGSSWTMGAMVAHTAGLPLKVPIDGNSYGNYSSFLPGVTSLGDILGAAGYNQELMVGSDAGFGGRSSYFSQHGDYRIFDLNAAIDEGFMTSDDIVWWGFEDKDLFAYAKHDILELAAQSAPFNFTMLTVDTHASEGWMCSLCEELFDDPVANVIACSSRQVVDFVRWVQEQDFYEDTTIVIAGDHNSMQRVGLFDLLESDYVRTVVDIVINPAVQPGATKNRIAATMDLFPTTLAALGIGIEGDRLGLGTNLFSEQRTLLERYGVDYVNFELKKSSAFYNEQFLY